MEFASRFAAHAGAEEGDVADVVPLPLRHAEIDLVEHPGWPRRLDVEPQRDVVLVAFCRGEELRTDAAYVEGNGHDCPRKLGSDRGQPRTSGPAHQKSVGHQESWLSSQVRTVNALDA